MKKIILMLMLGAMACASQATLYIYDGFNYAADSNLRGTTTTMWSNNVSGGNPLATNRAGTLAYSGLPASTGGKIELPGYRSGFAGSVHRITWTNNTGTADLFASFILNVATLSTLQSNGLIFTLRSGKGSIVITNSTSNPSKFNIGLYETAGKTIYAWDTNGGNGYDVGTSYFVAMSYTNVTAATNAFAQFWVNPVLGQSNPGVAAGTLKVGNDVTTWNRVSVGNGNNASVENRSVIYIDEVRVASTWPEVTPIPEPATIGMLGLGAIITLLIRRMKS